MVIHNDCVCLEEEPLKETKVGPLPGMMQHICSFKVHCNDIVYILYIVLFCSIKCMLSNCVVFVKNCIPHRNRTP